MKENEMIVAFHIGRGGGFYNPGHVTYMPNVNCLQDLYDDITIIDEDEYGNKLPIEQHILLDSGGNEKLHGQEIYEKTGTLDLDGEYDSYHVCYLNETPDRYEAALADAVKTCTSWDKETRRTVVEYLAEQGYEKADLLMDEDTKEIYEGLSAFVDEDDPIDPYTFSVEELDENEVARLMKFKYGRIESCCLVYEDGTMFTPVDWEAADYPTSMEELEEYEWMDCRTLRAILLNGLPRILV